MKHQPYFTFLPPKELRRCSLCNAVNWLASPRGLQCLNCSHVDDPAERRWWVAELNSTDFAAYEVEVRRVSPPTPSGRRLAREAGPPDDVELRNMADTMRLARQDALRASRRLLLDLLPCEQCGAPKLRMLQPAYHWLWQCRLCRTLQVRRPAQAATLEIMSFDWSR